MDCFVLLFDDEKIPHLTRRVNGNFRLRAIFLRSSPSLPSEKQRPPPFHAGAIPNARRLRQQSPMPTRLPLRGIAGISGSGRGKSLRFRAATHGKTTPHQTARPPAAYRWPWPPPFRPRPTKSVGPRHRAHRTGAATAPSKRNSPKGPPLCLDRSPPYRKKRRIARPTESLACTMFFQAWCGLPGVLNATHERTWCRNAPVGLKEQKPWISPLLNISRPRCW